MAHIREVFAFYAPYPASYKRYVAGSFAPTGIAWSFDNRTAGFRIVGHGPSLRIECRAAGADANPYLAFAATIAAGMAGIREDLDCGDDYRGNAYVDSSLRALPSSLEQSVALLRSSALAREVFGEDVVEFYAHTGTLEVEAFKNSVTDWEKSRYFERI